MENFYNLLGIPENASQEDIKKAYRRLALIHHPDKNDGTKESEEKFKALKSAYDELCNNDKRIQYDMALAAIRREENLKYEQEKDTAKQRDAQGENVRNSERTYKATGNQAGQDSNLGFFFMAIAIIAVITLFIVAFASTGTDETFPNGFTNSDSNPVS
jgi:DnaJ-class molecular chaperone